MLAQQWVVPDAAGRIRMPVGLEHAVEDLEIRAWLDYTEDVSVDDLALVKETPVAVARCGCSALVARCGMYHAYMPVLSVPSTLVLPIARDVNDWTT
ncbi:hypothetical protein XGA_2994 [Xanthomonas hortorum ATCC 19865]|nr:hypothetical protein XGA_2994 [Xanthomonas hortorum ATCC 19865]